MAMINTLDPDAARKSLTPWFAQQLGDGVAIRNLEIPGAGGFSMTTALVTLTTPHGERELAVRISPSGPGLVKSPDLGREFRVMTALRAHTNIAVPTPRWLEQDNSVLGSSFMVCDRVRGRVPPDDPPYTAEGWVLDLEPARRGVLYEHAAQVLAAVHAVDWRALGLDFLSQPEFGKPGMDEQLAIWRDMYTWACDGKASSGTIEAALEWAQENCPTGEDLVLNWGDPRIGNIVYRDDLSVSGVLDWEFASIASPEYDLGWFVFIIRYYTEAMGIDQPEGLPSPQEMVARWEQLTGRTAQHVEYYEVIAALRLSIMMVRAAQLMIDAGAIPTDSPMGINNPASQMLARLAPVPAPEGQTVTHHGQRNN
jgi:aminoglycoside phosphotransferase (APT) family kinase protein